MDIDHDGDIDLVGTRWNEVFYYENSAGDGLQWTKHIITTAIYSNPTLDFGDIDNDGDTDIIVAAERDSYVPWLENVNGDASQWQEHLVAYYGNVQRLELVDFDGDGDLDAMVSAYNTSAYTYGTSYLFENISGDGSSWAYHLIKDYLNWTTYTQAGDMNGDGKLDVVVMEEDVYRTNEEQLSFFDVSDFVGNGQLQSQALDGDNAA